MDWTWIYSSGPEHVCLQECPNKKGAWLIEAKRVFPIGTEVLVKDCSPHAPSPGVESVSSTAYRRTIRIDEIRGTLEVRPGGNDEHLCVRIRLPDTHTLIRVAERVRHLFDLGADPTEIATHLRRDPIL